MKQAGILSLATAAIHDESREWAALPHMPANMRFRGRAAADAPFAGTDTTD